MGECDCVLITGSLRKGKVLSKVDLSKGFHQVELTEVKKNRTCVVCPFGKFSFRQMPFG